MAPRSPAALIQLRANSPERGGEKRVPAGISPSLDVAVPLHIACQLASSILSLCCRMLQHHPSSSTVEKQHRGLTATFVAHFPNKHRGQTRPFSLLFEYSVDFTCIFGSGHSFTFFVCLFVIKAKYI